MRIVPKGAFLLGSPPSDPDHSAVEEPRKRIEIPSPFAIGIFPVLVSEYEALMGTLPKAAAQPTASRGLFGLFKHPTSVPTVAPLSLDLSAPVNDVSYDEAAAFVSRLSAATGEPYRLPSETEWEYACRAGSQNRYSFGDTIDASKAAFGADAGPVVAGSFPPNSFGLLRHARQCPRMDRGSLARVSPTKRHRMVAQPPWGTAQCALCAVAGGATVRRFCGRRRAWGRLSRVVTTQSAFVLCGCWAELLKQTCLQPRDNFGMGDCLFGILVNSRQRSISVTFGAKRKCASR